jgi:ArsR family transcriptional regulator
MIYGSWKLFADVLSNKTRFDIVTLLRKEGELNVSEICKRLGYEQSRVSHNLKCLLNCGFVDVEQRGKNRIYRISDEVKRILDELEEYIAEYEKRLVSCGVLREERSEKDAILEDVVR